MKRWTKSALLIIVVTILLFTPLTNAQASAATILKLGSNNGDVWDLQYRLQQLDYNIAMDGQFGPQTYAAVKQFQKNYGLLTDGIVGPVTWRTLKGKSLSLDEFKLLTRLVYSEARGEPYKGQVAVAAVALNRIDSSQFPNTLKGVIFQEKAFTAVDDGQFWLTPDGTAKNAALDAIRGWDPAKGALFYFNPKTATSSWIWSRPQILQIGEHIFTN